MNNSFFPVEFQILPCVDRPSCVRPTSLWPRGSRAQSLPSGWPRTPQACQRSGYEGREYEEVVTEPRRSSPPAQRWASCKNQGVMTETSRENVIQRKGIKGSCDLYVSELGDLQVARSSLAKQEKAFLRHRDFTDAVGGLDTGRQLVDTLAVVKVVNDLSGQVDILGLSVLLLPEGVKQSEEFRLHLLWFAYWTQRDLWETCKRSVGCTSKQTNQVYRRQRNSWEEKHAQIQAEKCTLTD